MTETAADQRDVEPRTTCAYPKCAVPIVSQGAFFLCRDAECRRSHVACPQCGSANRAHALHCTRCGGELDYDDAVARDADRFEFSVPLGTLLREQTRAFCIPLEDPQPVSRLVLNGYLFVVHKDRQRRHGHDYRLLIADPRTGNTVAERGLPAYIVGHPVMHRRHPALIATRGRIFKLDLTTLALSPLCDVPEVGWKFAQMPVFGDRWYVVVGDADSRAFSVYWLSDENGAMQKVVDLQSEPEMAVVHDRKVVLLCGKGGVIVSKQGVRQLPKWPEPPNEEVGEGSIAYGRGLVFFATDSRVACFDVESFDAAFVSNLTHQGNAKLTVAGDVLYVADGSGLRSVRISSRYSGVPPKTLSKRPFATRVLPFGRYVAGVLDGGNLMVLDGETGAEIAAKRFHRLTRPPTYFNGCLYVLSDTEDGLGGELNAFRLTSNGK